MENIRTPEAIKFLDRKISSIQTAQLIIFSILIGSSESFKENIKLSIDKMLKHKDVAKLSAETINYLNEIHGLVDQSDRLKEIEESSSLFELIQGGKKDQ